EIRFISIWGSRRISESKGRYQLIESSVVLVSKFAREPDIEHVANSETTTLVTSTRVGRVPAEIQPRPALDFGGRKLLKLHDGIARKAPGFRRIAREAAKRIGLRP